MTTVKMKSRVAELARKKGIVTPQQLSFAAQITWPTAATVLRGSLAKTQGETLLKLARTLGCKIEDLFTESEASQT